MKRFGMFLVMVSAAATAGAQNLIQNSGFDENADGWDLSMYSTWSNRVDHGNSPLSGALQITTRSVDTGAQCVNLQGGATYVVSVWVEKDPEPSISPCASPASGPSIQFFDAGQCAGPTTQEIFFRQKIPEPDGWQQFIGPFTPPMSTRSMLLTLSGECLSNGTGIAIHYFDDISIVPDLIFRADFEVQGI